MCLRAIKASSLLASRLQPQQMMQATFAAVVGNNKVKKKKKLGKKSKIYFNIYFI